MERNLIICKYSNMKKQGIQKMILYTVESFANVKCFSLNKKKHHSGNINV